MDISEFRELAEKIVGVNLQRGAPHSALVRKKPESLYIVAGPGTGKTTALTVLLLKAIFVDDHHPESVMATTFTRKAAGELQSRITKTMLAFLEALGIPLDDPRFDVSAIRIGTLDELAQLALIEIQREAVSGQVVQNATMRRALFKIGAHRRGSTNRSDLDDYLIPHFGAFRGGSINALRTRLMTIWERLGHDRVDYEKWSRRRPRRTVMEALYGYEDLMINDRRTDFVTMEETFLEELGDGGALESWRNKTEVLLVDEYQDTNLLQDSIYREIARSAVNRGGWIALVGDDDQSLFRFRGATVDLFVRAHEGFETDMRTVTLNVNYRSTIRIIDFAGAFIELDETYQGARVPDKRALKGADARKTWTHTDDVPVLGIFREDDDLLADSLANAITALLDEGWSVPGSAEPLRVPQPGDIAVIGPSTKRRKGDRIRFYGHLADRLTRAGIDLFNPRGTALRHVPLVEKLGGRTLLCLDPDASLQPERLPFGVGDTFSGWRNEATRFMRTRPEPNTPHGLTDFVRAWQKRKPQGRRRKWPRQFPMMELLHELGVWLPELRRGSGVLYLEALTRTLDEVGGVLGRMGTSLLRDQWERCVDRLYWNFFVPLAMDEVEVDEEILEELPLDSVNALTVHQAKGLEFPVVFVDVSSDFRTNHRSQRILRFPPNDENLGSPFSLEDDLRRYSSLGLPHRSQRDRACDDLIRNAFVAFTRAQHLLILFGLGEGTPKPIPNLYTGWTRDDNDRWDDLGVHCL